MQGNAAVLLQCYAMLCYVMLCYVMPCYAVLCMLRCIFTRSICVHTYFNKQANKTCMHTYVHTYVHTSMHIYVDVCSHAYMQVCMYVYGECKSLVIHLHACNLCRLLIRTCTCTQIYLHRYIGYVSVYAYWCECIYIYIPKRQYTQLYIDWSRLDCVLCAYINA